MAANSHVPYSALTKEELRERMKKNLHGELRIPVKQKNRAKIEQMVKQSGIVVDDELHNDFRKVIADSSLIKTSQNEFAGLFWDEQAKAATHKDARGMRWHPLMIKWCIYLQHLSQAAYNTLRNTLTLPSERTLQDSRGR